MKISPQELLLQKCVDGELSDAERSAFLKSLNDSGSLERWRTLALSFVENQVFAQSFSVEESPETIRPAPRTEKPAPFYRRQIRPWASVAASLLVGALVGVGGHFWMQPGDGPDQLLTTNSLAPSASTTQQPLLASDSLPSRAIPVSSGPQIMSSSGSPTPVMNVSLGRSSEGAQPVSVPVFSPEQWQAISKSNNQTGNQTTIPEDIQKLLESEGYRLDRERHWYRARLDDGREVLVPAETMRVRPALQ